VVPQEHLLASAVISLGMLDILALPFDNPESELLELTSELTSSLDLVLLLALQQELQQECPLLLQVPQLQEQEPSALPFGTSKFQNFLMLLS
jgi:hypothetical protein